MHGQQNIKFFNLLGVRWRQVATFKPWTLYRQGKIPSIHCVEGWVEPSYGLEASGRRYINTLTLPWGGHDFTDVQLVKTNHNTY
jgi:hypothetical protein